MIKIGLDLGNSRTKIATKINDELKTFQMPSLVQTGYNELSTENKIKVEYLDSIYSVGIGNGVIHKNRYFTSQYKIIFLTALAKLVQQYDETCTNIEADVVISLPVDLYKDKVLKEDIVKEIKNWGVQKITVDDSEFTIQVNNCDIWIEGGIILTDQRYFDTKKIVVYDIGGYTVEILEFIYGKLHSNRTISDYGIISLKQKLYNEFKNSLKTELDLKGIDEFFEMAKLNRRFSLGTNEVELTKYYNYIKDYISDSFSEISLGLKTDDKEIIFIGGGSLELKDFFDSYKNRYNFRILKNADFINSLTNLECANAKFNISC